MGQSILIISIIFFLFMMSKVLDRKIAYDKAHPKQAIECVVTP